MMTYFKRIIDSPVGKLTLVATDENLVALLFENDRFERVGGIESKGKHKILDEVEKQLDEYFQGKRQVFHVPLEMEGTAFQKTVWRALRKIPYGKTSSYGELAKRIGSPKASRAVGAANGRNPISIIVPCHRVIGSKGDLTGFGGGLQRKETLLNLERGA